MGRDNRPASTDRAKPAKGARSAREGASGARKATRARAVRARTVEPARRREHRVAAACRGTAVTGPQHRHPADRRGAFPDRVPDGEVPDVLEPRFERSVDAMRPGARVANGRRYAAGGGCFSTCGSAASIPAQRGADDVQIVIAGSARFGSSNEPTRTKIRCGRDSASLKSGVRQYGQNRRRIELPLSATLRYVRVSTVTLNDAVAKQALRVQL